MAVVCPICREVAYVSGGFFVVHGFRDHGEFVRCAGSGMRYWDCVGCSD